MIRGLGVLLGTSSAATLVWIAWAIATPGDSFGNGSSLLLPSLAAAGVIGGAAGAALVRRWPRVLLVTFLGCVGYWALAPGGWWAKPPPGINRGPP